MQYKHFYEHNTLITVIKNDRLVKFSMSPVQNRRSERLANGSVDLCSEPKSHYKMRL